MPKSDKTKILSIEEFNKIFNKLQNNEELTDIGTFLEVDIVFIAALFLWYKQNEQNWRKIPQFFNLELNDNVLNHSHYFKQISELYEITPDDIFNNFPYASNKQANSFSKYFAPPIYINEENLNCFFGERTNGNINKLKEKYIKEFKISDFIDTRVKNYKHYKLKFSNYETEIRKRLRNYSPIFTFIFIVASKNLSNKENQSFNSRKEYIEKLILFTQDFVRGLYELAKNIVEHSGQDGVKGEGMITIRTYSKSESDKTKILETHVFDYGTKGIIPKFFEDTKEKAIGNNVKNERIKKCYISDYNLLNKNKSYEIKNFITPRENEILRQQTFRHTSHYGINKLYKLLQNPLNGEIFATSKGLLHRDYFGKDAEDLTLKDSTHYFLKIPFIPDNFKNIAAKPFSDESQTATLGETASLEFLSKLNYRTINLNQLPKISVATENSLIDITISDLEITKDNVDNIYNQFDKLHDYTDNNRIAINLQDKINDVSVLLRFLSYLTFEYRQPFIIYNVDYHIYENLLSDNKDFYSTRQSEAYWHKEKAILLFVRTKNDFYFSDILFGEDRENFLYVNNIVSKSFPNSISLLQDIKNKKRGEEITYSKTIHSNQNLRQFFYPKSNNLLPFDALLKNQNNNPIFISNLTTILKNPLIDRADTYNNINEYIDNFDGFRISNTHFKIGTKIHSEDFYYAKRLFQNSFYTVRLAMFLAIEIKKKVGSTNQSITLVGYELYSELLLSLIEKFLRDFGFGKENNDEKINHFITQSHDNNFKFLSNDSFKKYLENYKNRHTIIIVPIASTGSTANKIENEIRKQIFKHEIRTNNKTRQQSEKLAFEYRFYNPRYNILLAQPENGFETIKKTSTSQKSIIILPASWHKIKNCPLCFGVDNKGNHVETKILFETDKSSLTPALIFGNPKGKIKAEHGEEIESSTSYNDVDFQESLRYKEILRNNNYRIYYIKTDKFIENNLARIKYWLREKVKKHLQLNSTDKIVIVAPCHESNSRFLDLVNKIVFDSSATIIHYQNGVDFPDNFKLLNKKYLTEETKLFFVDDSLITGKHFYEVYDLVKDVHPNRLTFTASIFINDKSEPHTHNKVVELSKIYFSFANFNQPPTRNLLGQRPLEHERERYENLSKVSLHDVTIEFFRQKANGLNPQKLINLNGVNGNKEKALRRLKNFEATHKIYDYFAKNPSIHDYDIKEIVEFKELTPFIEKNLFPEYTKEVEKNRIEEQKENSKALLKVLSQYPFVLYQPLQVKTFNWLKSWLNEINTPNEDCFSPKDYHNFQTLKFLIRRATLLEDYQIVEHNFLKIILLWFKKIDKYFASSNSNKLKVNEKVSEGEKMNLIDFPIFLLRNYMEMIQKNGWVAYHILTNLNQIKFDLLKSKQGFQFWDMLQIESALVIDTFYNMIIDEKRIEWRDLFIEYKDSESLVTETDEIVNFFKTNKYLIESNKYLIVRETFLNNSDDWLNLKTPLINFFWIKQLILVDSIDENSHFPKNIDYQRKIDAIIEKMKKFFSQKQMNVFFIVTDGQQQPYILKDEQNLLEDFIAEKQNNDLSKESEKNIYKTQVLIDFLNGNDSSTYNAPETTTEFYREYSNTEVKVEFKKTSANKDSKTGTHDLFDNLSPNFGLATWTDAYNKKTAPLPFMPDDSKWLFLVRITQRNEHTNKFDTLGMLGFYSTENLFNSSHNLFPKQLLMLLRQDIGKFIEKHHKNDEFAGLRQQTEKNKYIFKLNHGVRTYEKAVKNILNNCDDSDLKESLETFYDYLITKLEIIDRLSSKSKSEVISLNDIKTEFDLKYKKVLCLNVSEVKGFNKEDIDNLVKIDYPGFDNNLNEEFKFPENSIKDIVFELLNNIRKNVCNRDTYLITEDSPLKIDVALVNEKGRKYLSVTNNHVRNLDSPDYEGDVPHGIDLLKQMWINHGLGKIITPVYPLTKRSFTIKIQLKG
ncbi:hypothetical protein SLH46_12610 [Draconibacterium sp. IB214405]|uniref:hypothetical protein n=1 Tax=Draconibacterium sp. IB214405 TaxID=3097352 RepID=UPI002A13DFCA|nr:hypothetical protein [Draconibacterium sp. IB214405]MDX8340034.1 hypothetical protein [Draconibacterium sp. IB214405]